MNHDLLKPFYTVFSSIFLGLIFIAVFLKLFFIDSHEVVGGSMADTLVHGDYILSWRLNRFCKAAFQYKDIVVFCLEGEKETLIKRVVGLPGDTIELQPDGIFINDRRLDEKYIKTKNNYPSLKIYHIAEGQIFVLGDNRLISRDSDDFGPVMIKDVKEKVFLVYYPINHLKWLP